MSSTEMSSTDMSAAAVQIRGLVDLYGICFDLRDRERFDRLWTPDGVLEIFQDGPAKERTGKLRPQHFGLAFDALTGYESTLHHVTTHHADIADATATGTTACAAHHVQRAADGAASDLVMHIRYNDSFRCDDGVWRFTHRRVNVLFTENRPVTSLR